MHHGLPRDRITDCIRQLFGGESPHHGDDSIVPANGMKSQGKRHEPESGGGDPAAAEVADHYSCTCDAIHLPEERCRVRIGKVMQNLRAHHDVHAAVRERQMQRVPANREAHRLPAGVRELGRRIQTNSGQLQPVLAGEGSGATRDVAESGADVEERGAPREVVEGAPQLVERGAHPAEQSVAPRDIGQGPGYHLRIHVRKVEDLDAAPARRSEKRRHSASAPAERSRRDSTAAGFRSPRGRLLPRRRLSCDPRRHAARSCCTR